VINTSINFTPGENSVRVLVVFYSRFGAIKALADLVAEGARRVENVDVRIVEIEDQPIDERRPGESDAEMIARREAAVRPLVEADAIIVGAPGYFGTMASAVKRWFEDCAMGSDPPDRTRPWLHHRFRDKFGAAFTTSATPHGGNEQTLHSILTMFMHLGMIVVTPGQQQPILENEAPPYGPTGIVGPAGDRPLTETEQASARDLGEHVANIAACYRRGAAERARA
jgi:NAD(P)H dehydrogenase (quinone)